MKWALDNSVSFGGDTSRITAIGHSAGGSILGTALWRGYLEDAGIQDKVACYVFLSAGLWYDVLNPPTSINMAAYHRTTDLDRIRREMPQGLFISADKARISSKSVFFVAEYEFDEIVEGTMGCVETYREKLQRFPLIETIEGENHVSYIYTLGTKGNRMGPRLLELVNKFRSA